MERKMAHFSLRLNSQIKQNAVRAAAEDHRSLSSLIEVLLARHCQERALLMDTDRLPEGGRKCVSHR